MLNIISIFNNQTLLIIIQQIVNEENIIHNIDPTNNHPNNNLTPTQNSLHSNNPNYKTKYPPLQTNQLNNSLLSSQETQQNQTIQIQPVGLKIETDSLQIEKQQSDQQITNVQKKKQLKFYNTLDLYATTIAIWKIMGRVQEPIRTIIKTSLLQRFAGTCLQSTVARCLSNDDFKNYLKKQGIDENILSRFNKKYLVYMFLEFYENSEHIQKGFTGNKMVYKSLDQKQESTDSSQICTFSIAKEVRSSGKAPYAMPSTCDCRQDMQPDCQQMIEDKQTIMTYILFDQEQIKGFEKSSHQLDFTQCNAQNCDQLVKAQIDAVNYVFENLVSKYTVDGETSDTQEHDVQLEIYKVLMNSIKSKMVRNIGLAASYESIKDYCLLGTDYKLCRSKVESLFESPAMYQPILDHAQGFMGNRNVFREVTVAYTQDNGLRNLVNHYYGFCKYDPQQLEKAELAKQFEYYCPFTDKGIEQNKCVCIQKRVGQCQMIQYWGVDDYDHPSAIRYVMHPDSIQDDEYDNWLMGRKQCNEQICSEYGKLVLQGIESYNKFKNVPFFNDIYTIEDPIIDDPDGKRDDDPIVNPTIDVPNIFDIVPKKGRDCYNDRKMMKQVNSNVKNINNLIKTRISKRMKKSLKRKHNRKV